jgi:hypothetical protein
MSSQKKDGPKQCIKCHHLLTNKNWNKYDKDVSHYICSLCRKEQDKTRYTSNSEYNKKQISRYHRKRSAVIHAYGDSCVICGSDDYEKLMIENINNKKVKSLYEYLYNQPPLKNEYQVLCYNCNANKNTKYKDKYFLINKKIVIEKFGNKCRECGEDKITLLTIAYKNEIGVEKRRQNKCCANSAFYRSIIKNNFIDNDLEVLCYNCNQVI